VFRKSLLVATIVLVSALLGVVAYEVTIRMSIAKQVSALYGGMPLWLQNQTLTPSPVDAALGRVFEAREDVLFKPNARFDLGVEVGGRTGLDFSVRTNNLGLLQDRDVEVARSSDDPEFRILVFGDSLTGTVTANYQWVDTVEDLLNAVPRVRRAVGGKRFRVYNLGWVAAGFGHFFEVYERIGARLEADLLVVNFTYDDFPRMHRGPRFEHGSDMIEHAAGVLRRFRNTGIPLIVTQMPLYAEIVPKSVSFPMSRELESRVPGLAIVDMRQKLPVAHGPSEVRRWYNLPYDHHMSDYGGELYARAMAGVIAKALGAQNVDFWSVRSSYFDPATCMPRMDAAPGDLVLRRGFADAPLDPVKVSDIPRALGEGWSVAAGGRGTRGAARIKRSSGDPLGAAPAAILFEQLRASTAGSPSLTNLLGRADFLSGKATRIRFSARADSERNFTLLLNRYHGSGSHRAADQSLEAFPFSASPEWRTISLHANIPAVDRGRLGSRGDDHLRLQIVPQQPDATFQLEISMLEVYVLREPESATAGQNCALRPRVETTVRRILSDQEAVARLRSAVVGQLGGAKVWSLRPWFVDVAFRGIDPLIPPMTRALTGGFVPVRYGDRDDEVAFLNVFCTAGEVSLTNPACYTNQHFFVR
jgi:hypothetical protein